MSHRLNATHDPSLQSWVPSAQAPQTDFPIQNLPFAVFRPAGDEARCGVGIGDRILDVGACADLFDGLAAQAALACRTPRLNALMALGPAAASALRAGLSRLLSAGQAEHRDRLGAALHAIDSVDLVMPVQVGGFTDFFASIHHATNAGRLFRPDMPLLTSTCPSPTTAAPTACA